MILKLGLYLPTCKYRSVKLLSHWPLAGSEPTTFRMKSFLLRLLPRYRYHQNIKAYFSSVFLPPKNYWQSETSLQSISSGSSFLFSSPFFWVLKNIPEVRATLSLSLRLSLSLSLSLFPWRSVSLFLSLSLSFRDVHSLSLCLLSLSLFLKLPPEKN